jgi:hypothetical protein
MPSEILFFCSDQQHCEYPKPSRKHHTLITKKSRAPLLRQCAQGAFCGAYYYTGLLMSNPNLTWLIIEPVAHLLIRFVNYLDYFSDKLPSFGVTIGCFVIGGNRLLVFATENTEGNRDLFHKLRKRPNPQAHFHQIRRSQIEFSIGQG